MGFEVGEQVTVGSSEKEMMAAAVKSTHLEVGFVTNKGIEAIYWYNVFPMGTLSVSRADHQEE